MVQIRLETVEEERNRFTGDRSGFRISKTCCWIGFGSKVDSSVYIYRESEVQEIGKVIFEVEMLM